MQSSATLSSRQLHLGIIVFPPPSARTLAIPIIISSTACPTLSSTNVPNGTCYSPEWPKAVLNAPLAWAVL